MSEVAPFCSKRAILLCTTWCMLRGSSSSKDSVEEFGIFSSLDELEFAITNGPKKH